MVAARFQWIFIFYHQPYGTLYIDPHPHPNHTLYDILCCTKNLNLDLSNSVGSILLHSVHFSWLLAIGCRILLLVCLCLVTNLVNVRHIHTQNNHLINTLHSPCTHQSDNCFICTFLLKYACQAMVNGFARLNSLTKQIMQSHCNEHEHKHVDAHVMCYIAITLIADKQSNINEDTKKAWAQEHTMGVKPKDQMKRNNLIKMFEMTFGWFPITLLIDLNAILFSYCW